MELKIDQGSFRKHVAEWFAYQILYAARYEIDYSNCPPWDASGTARHIGVFCLADYATLASFLEEPTGETTASYVSGCGLFHNYFNEELGKMAEDYVQDLALQIGEKPDEDGEWSSAAAHAILEVCIELSEIAPTWACPELFAEGADAAHKKHFEEHVEAEVRRIEHAAQLCAGKMLVQRCGYTSEMGIVRKATANWETLREALLHLSENDLKLVSHVLPASNSITLALSLGKVPSVGQLQTTKKKTALKRGKH